MFACDFINSYTLIFGREFSYIIIHTHGMTALSSRYFFVQQCKHFVFLCVVLIQTISASVSIICLIGREKTAILLECRHLIHFRYK